MLETVLNNVNEANADVGYIVFVNNRVSILVIIVDIMQTTPNKNTGNLLIL